MYHVLMEFAKADVNSPRSVRALSKVSIFNRHELQYTDRGGDDTLQQLWHLVKFRFIIARSSYCKGSNLCPIHTSKTCLVKPGLTE